MARMPTGLRLLIQGQQRGAADATVYWLAPVSNVTDLDATPARLSATSSAPLDELEALSAPRLEGSCYHGRLNEEREVLPQPHLEAGDHLVRPALVAELLDVDHLPALGGALAGGLVLGAREAIAVVLTGDLGAAQMAPIEHLCGDVEGVIAVRRVDHVHPLSRARVPRSEGAGAERVGEEGAQEERARGGGGAI